MPTPRGSGGDDRAMDGAPVGEDDDENGGCRVGVDTKVFFSTGVGVLLPCDEGAAALFLD